MNKIAQFFFTQKKLWNRRDKPWQVRYQVKAHNPGMYKLYFKAA